MKSPAAILFDVSGSAMAVLDAGTISSGTHGFLMLGKDGSLSRMLRVGSDGVLVTRMNYAQMAYHSASLWATETAIQTLPSDVSGSSLIMRSVVCSSTGNGRFEIKVGASGSEVTAYVVYTSESRPTLEIDFFGQVVPNGHRVLIVKTGQDRYPQALDYHSSIAYYFA